MPGVVRSLLPGVVVVGIGVALAGSLAAHDIPNARVDRAIQVVLRPGRLEVDYEVSLAELTLAQDLRSLIGRLPPEVATRQDLYGRYAEETGPLNARGFLVSIDGYPLELSCEGYDLAVEEHPRFTFHLSAPLPDRGRLALLDTNYAASEGTSRLALRGLGEIAVRRYDGPADVTDVPERPVWMLSDAEERRTKEVEVDFGPPDTPVEGEDGSRSSDLASSTVAGGPEIADTTPGGEPSRTGRSAGIPERNDPDEDAEIVANRDIPSSRGLGRLLDRASGASVLALCLIAFGLGTAHAVQPGHGKTLVAAATIGEGGAWWRGAVLAAITTVAHTGGVVALAGVLWITRTTRYGPINAALLGAAGFLIAAVGLWRVGRHLGGHGEHEAVGFRDPLDPSDDPGHRSRPGLRGLVGLGLAGGLVPCWDAVILILLADALGRLALGLALLAAFSAGMAVVLVVVGLVVARVGGLFARRDRQGRWERRLGLLSGVVLAGIGLVMLARA